MLDPIYGRLLGRTLLASVVAAGLVAVCYYGVDRQVAWYVHDYGINQHAVFRWLTYPPPIAQTWTPLVLVAVLIRRARGPLACWQQTLLVACLGLLIADQFRTSLGDLFGRYWPETWFNNNKSLIGTGTYGFHPLVHGDDVGSFPSGHAARIVGFAGVWWLAMPGTRLIWLIACPPMLVALVAMNYHFVGDVVGGSAVGGIVAMWAQTIAQHGLGTHRTA